MWARFPCVSLTDPGYMSRKFRKLRTDKFDRETNGNFDSCSSCKRPVYMSYMSKIFRVFLKSNLSVLNFRICLLMYPGSPSRRAARCVGGAESVRRGAGRRGPGDPAL